MKNIKKNIVLAALAITLSSTTFGTDNTLTGFDGSSAQYAIQQTDVKDNISQARASNTVLPLYKTKTMCIKLTAN